MHLPPSHAGGTLELFFTNPQYHALGGATTTMSNQQQAVSLRPSTFAIGGSLLDDVDVTYTRARFGYGYGEGKAGDDAVTLQVVMTDGDKNEHFGYYSVGQGFVPSDTGKEGDDANGKFLVPVGDKTAPNNSSNFALLLISMVNAGVPEDMFDGDISQIEGLVGHVNRVPAPKRNNLPTRPGQKANNDPTILLFTTLISLPGEKAKPALVKAGAKPGATAANAAKTTTTTTAAATGDTDELEMELMGLFATEGTESMKKIDIVKGLFKTIDSTNPNKKSLLAMAGKEDVLKSLSSFTFDGKELKSV